MAQSKNKGLVINDLLTNLENRQIKTITLKECNDGNIISLIDTSYPHRNQTIKDIKPLLNKNFIVHQDYGGYITTTGTELTISKKLISKSDLRPEQLEQAKELFEIIKELFDKYQYIWFEQIGPGAGDGKLHKLHNKSFAIIPTGPDSNNMKVMFGYTTINKSELIKLVDKNKYYRERQVTSGTRIRTTIKLYTEENKKECKEDFKWESHW